MDIKGKYLSNREIVTQIVTKNADHQPNTFITKTIVNKLVSHHKQTNIPIGYDNVIWMLNK